MGPVPVRATKGAGPKRPSPPSMPPGARVPPPPMHRRKPLQPRAPPPPPPRRRSARGCCCVCCLWLVLVLLCLAFLGAVAAGALYVVYHPQLPAFAVTSVRLAALNVSDLDAVTSRIEFTVTARNPNEKVAFAYGDIAVSFSADGGDGAVGACVVPGFLHPAGNTTVVRAAATAAALTVDPLQAAALASRKFHDLSARMDSQVGFQIGRFKSRRIEVVVTCGGISASLAKPEPDDVAAAPAPAHLRGRSPPRSVVVRTSSSSLPSSSSTGGAGGAEMTVVDAKCKLKVKVWIWTF